MQGYNVGIGITTHNRRDVFLRTLAEIKKHSAGAKVVVVDDGSDTPVNCADYRFPSAQGIAVAKNKCLELLADCEHIFLFDDDTYPTSNNWWKPYLFSPEPHLMYIFSGSDSTVLFEDSQHKSYSHPRGCMLYLHWTAIERCGGFDPIFGRWGGEHGDLSSRIYNAGLTRWRFGDVANPQIYCSDESGLNKRSVPLKERLVLAARNDALVAERYESGCDSYVEYRPQRDVVLTCLLTNVADPQRGQRLSTSLNQLSVWGKSLKGCEGIAFIDFKSQIDSNNKFNFIIKPVEPMKMNPYFARWHHAYTYLRENEDIRYVFCTDGTDVEMQTAPWDKIKPGKLYVGSESVTVSDPWLALQHPNQRIQDWIHENSHETMLNAGVVGGNRQIMLKFLHRLLQLYYDTDKHGVGDMALFNMAAREFDPVFGPQITTVFRANERNSFSWFKHK